MKFFKVFMIINKRIILLTMFIKVIKKFLFIGLESILMFNIFIILEIFMFTLVFIINVFMFIFIKLLWMFMLFL